MRDAFGAMVRRPVGLLVTFATLLVVGLIAYVRIPLQLLPEGFSADSVQVWIPNPGGSARENEEQVARIVEGELRTLQGIEKVTSRSQDDLVTLRIQFQPSVDMELAKAEVRDRLERARPQLPASTEQIGMWSESGGSLPLAFFSVLVTEESDESDYMIDEIALPHLEAASGVSRVQVWGLLQDSMRIELDEERVAAANLDVGALIQRLSADNFSEPLGEVVDGGRRLILRADMRFSDPEEIARFPIGNGATIGDLAEVRRAKSVRDQLSRVDGAWAYFGIVQKESTANVVEASENLQAAMAELERDPRLAGRLSFVPFFVQGDMIRASLDQLQQTAVGGGLLAAAILLLFLRRVRTTLCVALAIPVSALFALAFEYFTGGSFNMLTMIGITLGIGMLVDNAVVVVENIVRARGEVATDLEAAARGTREIALPVTLATLTTVVVFLPIIFMSENPMVRIMFGGMGIPLCTSLLASLLVAVFFLPTAVARTIGPRSRSMEALARLLDRPTRLPARAIALGIGAARALFHAALAAGWFVERPLLRILRPLRWVLAPVLVAAGVRTGLANAAGARLLLETRGGLTTPPDAVLAAPWIVAGVVAAGLALLLGARRPRAAAPARPARFVPAGHSLIDWMTASNRALVAWTLGHRIPATGLAVLAFLTVMIPLGRMGRGAMVQGEGSNSLEFGVSFDADFTLAEAAGEMRLYEDFLDGRRDELDFEHWRSRFDDRGGSVGLFWPTTLRSERRDEVVAFLERELPRPAGHRVRLYDSDAVTDMSRTVARFTLRGTDSIELAALGREARRLLEGVPGLTGVAAPDDDAPEQIEVVVDRDLAHSFGIGAQNAIQSISWALRGVPLPRFQEADRDIPLVIEYDEADPPNLASLRDLPVYTVSNQVPLSAIADFEFGKGSNTIVREDGQISYSLTAQVTDPSRSMEATEAGYRALAALELPRGFSLARENSMMSRADEELGELMRAFALSVVLVFLVMGILFESVLLPVSVLTTIPFAVLGAVWSLWAMGRPLDPMGLIGLIILAGVVVNNGIVLIDRIHRLRDGLARSEAVLAGCAQRVRPIVMTALTTVTGLLPMALMNPASGSIDYRAMASIVIGGLLAGTFFTLWTVPLAYTLLDDLGRSVARATAWAAARGSRAVGTR